MCPSDQGELTWVAASEPLGETFAELVVQHAREGRRSAELCPIAEHEGYLKGGALARGPAWRHGLRRHVLRRSPPRLREFEHLVWLRKRHFEAPRPLAAAVLWRTGLPRYQALFTEYIPNTETLEDFLAHGEAPGRATVLAELAREVARLHALGFVHHDLFARNLLVRGARPERRIVFLDAWAGGTGWGTRGPAYDLACLFLDATELLSDDEQTSFLDAYFAARSAQGRPAERTKLLAAARHLRGALRRRLEREPKRQRGRALPRAEW
ncbi:MAG: hypothetical protein GY711_14980 [bacterium]|nr:hypothetical protein [bacterium]